MRCREKELEMMLFDPQVTEEAQLGHLARLEDELDAARGEIRTLRAARELGYCVCISNIIRPSSCPEFA